jgi:hypothetical protein
VRLKSSDIPSGKAWQKAIAGLNTCQTVSIRSEDRYGFLYQIALAAERHGRCPHVALWVNAGAIPARQQGDCEQRIAGALDALMQEDGLQAFLTCWKWIPQFDTVDNYDITPYESACGARAPDSPFMGDKWCSRFLRGVGEQMWLGPDLLNHIGGSAALEPAAEVRRIGSCVHATLRQESSLDALESALAPILPGVSDFIPRSGAS